MNADWWGHDGYFGGPNNVCFLTGVRGALNQEKEFYLDERSVSSFDIAASFWHDSPLKALLPPGSQASAVRRDGVALAMTMAGRNRLLEEEERHHGPTETRTPFTSVP